MSYFYGITSMWSAISTKIGRAVGAKDAVSIGKFFKMAIYLAGGSGVLTWALLYPFGPMLLKALYAPKKAVYDLAWPYMYIHALGKAVLHCLLARIIFRTCDSLCGCPPR